MLQFIIWLVISYITMSLAEYIIHKNFMHKRFFPKGVFDAVFEEHAILHHKNERNDLNIDLPLSNHLIIGSPILVGLAALAPIGMLAWLCIIIYHSYLWTHSHRAIHGLEHNWLENTNFYRQIKKHHENHHKYPNRNFGVCFQWVDRMFKTKI